MSRVVPCLCLVFLICSVILYDGKIGNIAVET